MYKKVETWFDIVQLEKGILAFWEKHRVFEKLVKKNEQGDPWSFLDGPITANNPMGVHHAWGRTLKDVYQRYWAMNNRRQRYQNGYDCQGLWVEVEVEKELGFTCKKDIEEYGIDRFVNKCKERATRFSEIITQQSQRLGFWMDWNNNYYTMSDENNYTIWGFLKRCHERGLIYRGKDVMPWCPRCGTGISQHEMQEGYKDASHLSVVVVFPIAGKEKEAFLVWTTTPWTLTANVAIALHPDSDYIKVKQGEWIYYLIKSRAREVLKAGGDYQELETLKGEDLLSMGFSYTGPFDELPLQQDADYRHQVIAWEEISEEEGTGIVHIAPGCGAEDFELGKELGLPALMPIDENGTLLESTGWLSGKHASSAGEEIKEALIKKKILYNSEMYHHSYPHCWRCSTELLFRLVDEWFIAMDPWREEIKAVARQINWIPSFGLDLELDWLNNMRDWMISKKRFWGLALPIWTCDECHTFTVIGSLEELKEKAVAGLDAFDGHSPHRPWIDEVKVTCPDCGKPISRIPDVGNPWLDAGIVPYSTVKYNTDRQYWQQWIPADLILECFPGQFRNWFYSLLAMSTMMENIPPFKTLVGHALVRDEKGEEMHKSKGNAIWFDDAADRVGVEVMRWIFCSHEMSTNLNFGWESAKQIRGKLINTLWNSYAFFVNYARLINFEPQATPIPFDQRPDFDRWLLSKMQILIQKCRQGFETYDVRSSARAVEEFMEFLSNWYIRCNRRRFWRSELDDDTMSAFNTLYEVLFAVLRLVAPILPFLTEKMYQNMVRQVDMMQPISIHLSQFPQQKKEWIDQKLVEEMDVAVRINATALAAREKSGYKIRQPLAELIVAPNSDNEVNALKRFEELLKNELNVKEIRILEKKTECPVEWTVQPSKKFLGKKYKADAGKIIAALEKEVASFKSEAAKNQNWSYDLDIEGKIFKINREDLMIEPIDPPGLSIITFHDGWLAVNNQLSDDLRQEGFMREFLRQMQVLRKKVGLEIEDRITISYQKPSDSVKQMMGGYKDFICQELLCLELHEETSLELPHTIQINGDSLLVDIQRATT